MTHPQLIAPCFWLDGAADALSASHTRLFPRSRIHHASRYGKEGFEHHRQPEGQTLAVEMELDGFRLTAINGGPKFKINPSISLFVERTSQAEIDHLWHGLTAGGQVLMPIGAYPWSPSYGWVNDRFGLSWQLMLQVEIGGGPADAALANASTIAPFLMFTGAQCGRAEDAIRRYTSIFSQSALTAMTRHDGAGQDKAGTVLAARFILGGQPFRAMDSVGPHAFGFNEAVSLTVMCETQTEIDLYWNALIADGGAESMCGWLKDPFGVSWQILPAGVPKMMSSRDQSAVSRVMTAILGMRKLDIAKLEAAFAGQR